MLLNYGLLPSSTFLNQAVAILGWGLFTGLLLDWHGRHPPSVPGSTGRPNLGLVPLALVTLSGCALLTAWLESVPDSIFLPPLAMMGAAAWTATAAAQSTKAWAFKLFCLALVVAGALSALIACIQVFAPSWTEVLGLAAAAGGRAAGNLRQANHLSSLLLWSLVAVLWVGEVKTALRVAAAVVAALLLFAIVLTASRTGLLGVGMLAVWGVLDRRLSRWARGLLLALPLIYFAGWLGMDWWAAHTQTAFAGEARFTTEGNYSSSRFAIWSNALTLIAQNPWTGVGWGGFNFAWTLTPFPDRPTEFFDHAHNLPLHLAAELGLPLAALVMGLLLWALWRAFRASRQASGDEGVMLRCAFMMVLLIGVHSLLEYPLWYAYFLLPTAFAWGLCLGNGIGKGESTGGDAPVQNSDAAGAGAGGARGATQSQPIRPGHVAMLMGPVLMVLGGIASVVDYHRVVPIFSPSADSMTSLDERIADGQQSLLFAHHAHYAAATTAVYPSDAMVSFKVASGHLLDTRLMMGWAQAFAEVGDTERARYIAQRLREFHHPEAAPFFAVCNEPVPAGSALPFQCAAPTKAFTFRDFR